VRQIWTAYRLQPSQSSQLKKYQTRLPPISDTQVRFSAAAQLAAAEGQIRKTWTVARSRTGQAVAVLGAVSSRREQQCVSRHAPPAVAYQPLTDARACAGYDPGGGSNFQLRPCRRAVGATYNLFLFSLAQPAKPWCLYGQQIEFK
jgi:hypothetical protein